MHFDDFTNQLLVRYADDVEQFGVAHTFGDDKRTGHFDDSPPYFCLTLPSLLIHDRHGIHRRERKYPMPTAFLTDSRTCAHA